MKNLRTELPAASSFQVGPLRALLTCALILVILSSSYGQITKEKVNWVKVIKTTDNYTGTIVSSLVDENGNYYVLMHAEGQLNLNGVVYENDTNHFTLMTCYDSTGTERWTYPFISKNGKQTVRFLGSDSSNIYAYFSGSSTIYRSDSLHQPTGIAIFSMDGDLKKFVRSYRFLSPPVWGIQKGHPAKNHGKQGIYAWARDFNSSGHLLTVLKDQNRLRVISEPAGFIFFDYDIQALPSGEVLVGIHLGSSPIHFKKFSVSLKDTHNYGYAMVKLDTNTKKFDLLGVFNGARKMQFEVDDQSGNIVVTGLLEADSFRYNDKGIIAKGAKDNLVLASFTSNGVLRWVNRTDQSDNGVYSLSALSIVDGIGRLQTAFGFGGFAYDNVSTTNYGSYILSFNAQTGAGLNATSIFRNKSLYLETLKMTFVDDHRQYAYVNLEDDEAVEINGITYTASQDTSISLFMLMDTAFMVGIQKKFKEPPLVYYAPSDQRITTSMPISGYHLKLYDLSGKLVVENNNCKAIQQTPVGHLDTGPYIVILESEKMTFSKKLVIY